MKLRIRFQARREVIEVDNSQCTITELIEIVGAHCFLTNVNFRLSLDGKTPLPADESSTLTDLGIVGGDLLYVVLEDDGNSSSISQGNHTNIPNQPSASSQLNASESEKLHETENVQCNNTMDTVAGSSNEKYEEENHITYSMENTPSKTGEDEESQIPGPSRQSEEPLKLRKIEYTPKALLCRDGIPYSLQMSYELANVTTMHEAVCVAVHVLMLETGFVNQDQEGNKTIFIEEPSTSSNNDHERMTLTTCSIMSHKWRTDSGAKFLYTHPACPELVCSVVCTSLGPYVLVHGMSNSPSCTEVYQCRLPAADFVKGNIDLKSNSAADVYKNLQRLSLVVKDQIAYPLLSSLRHELNLEEIYGFMALPTEVKLMVLCLLPVKNILSISATCREIQIVASDQILWQHLCFRDFALLTKGRYSTWKMEYQRHYKEIMERETNIHRRQFFDPVPDQPAGLFSGYNPNTIPGIIGGRHDMFPNVPFIPGGIHPNPGAVPTPGNLPRPRFDPYGPIPDMDNNPGPNRRNPGRGRGRARFPPGPFF